MEEDGGGSVGYGDMGALVREVNKPYGMSLWKKISMGKHFFF